MTDLLSLPLEELTQWVTETLGEPKFRAKQIYQWLHQKQVKTFGEMTNLSAALREKLGEVGKIATVETELRLESKVDGTRKFLFRLEDGNCVETVWMEYRHGPVFAFPPRWDAGWAVGFAPPPWGGWSGT